jgi:hypothetical protein
MKPFKPIYLAVFGLLFTWAGYIGAQPINPKPVPSNALELRISSSHGQQPVALKVQHNTWVDLKVQSDANGELHIHAYHLVFKVQANQPNSFQFQAKASGKFRLDWHPIQSNSAAHPHTPPAAWLKVYPN